MREEILLQQDPDIHYVVIFKEQATSVSLTSEVPKPFPTCSSHLEWWKWWQSRRSGRVCGVEQEAKDCKGDGAWAGSAASASVVPAQQRNREDSTTLLAGFGSALRHYGILQRLNCARVHSIPWHTGKIKRRGKWGQRIIWCFRAGLTILI